MRADRTPSHVQAWARDSSTGEPVYIMELGPERRGSKSGCECQSCDLPLTAVNAAKTAYIKRPHFRHPNGAEKSDCMILAARLAALQLLRDEGVFQLPARKVSGKVVGLSGTLHEVWIEHPAERLKIRDFDFRDKAWALITFDDGRQLRFHLIGSGIIDESGKITPSISLDLQDPELAGLSPEELRKRTTLISDGLCWNSHWKDIELQTQANQLALEKAIDFLDNEGEYQNYLSKVDKKYRRETLLHLEVKRILSEAKQISVPDIQCYVLRTADDGYDIEKSVSFPGITIPLTDVVLEKRFGRLIPDVTAQTTEDHGGVLLVEVTVTNIIDRDRQEKIKINNRPAIEIDLSRIGGLISREELRNLVIGDVACKRWLCHPKADLCQQELEAAADAELQERNWAIQAEEEMKRIVLKIPASIIAQEYLDAIEQHQALIKKSRIEDFDECSRLLMKISFHADRLKIHGFPEAGDNELFSGRSQIIPRILAIKNGGGIGYELDSTMKVLNAIKQAQIQNRKYHTIYLIAFKIYKPSEESNPPEWFINWKNEIINSIKSGEKIYIRNRKYDKLLSLLFPEMRANISKKFGTEDYINIRKSEPLRKLPITDYSYKKTSPSWPWNSSEKSNSFWLVGKELEEWKRNNPVSARKFFGNTGEGNQ